MTVAPRLSDPTLNRLGNGVQLLNAPTGSTNVGILFKGLRPITSALSFAAETSTRIVSISEIAPVSCAATIALRTNGERDDQ